MNYRKSEAELLFVAGGNQNKNFEVHWFGVISWHVLSPLVMFTKIAFKLLYVVNCCLTDDKKIQTKTNYIF